MPGPIPSTPIPADYNIRHDVQVLAPLGVAAAGVVGAGTFLGFKQGGMAMRSAGINALARATGAGAGVVAVSVALGAIDRALINSGVDPTVAGVAGVAIPTAIGGVGLLALKGRTSLLAGTARAGLGAAAFVGAMGLATMGILAATGHADALAKRT